MVYRISTENKNKNKINDLVSNQFPGFTEYTATGFYKSIKEKSLIIEIEGSKNIKTKIIKLCNTIKLNNNQDSILLQVFDTTSVFI